MAMIGDTITLEITKLKVVIRPTRH